MGKLDNKSICNRLMDTRSSSANLINNSNSLESVIFEKEITNKSNQTLRNLSTKVQNETIILTDDDQTVDSISRPCTSNRSENESVILLDDDDLNLSKVIKKKIIKQQS